MKASIVVPSNRPESIKTFLDAWEKEFQGHDVIVVEDGPEKTFEVPSWVRHSSWKEIDSDLKTAAWVIPRRTDAVRNYGFIVASRLGNDMIVSMDDDCMPDSPHFLDQHWNALQTPGDLLAAYDTMEGTVAPGIRPRGYPKKPHPVRTVVNHGLWNGIPDLDGETQLRVGDIRVAFAGHSNQVPRGTLFPMCGMNVAFRPEILPAMYFPPMGDGFPYHRFGDIWCGLIMKRACDILGLSVRSGAPFVRHERASSARRNASIEAPGIPENEELWEVLSGASGEPAGLEFCLGQLYERLARRTPYWTVAAKAAFIWRGLLAA